MRFLQTTLAGCLIVHSVFGQLQTRPLKEESGDQRARTQAIQTINPIILPFWDDFSISGTAPDSIRIWGEDTTLQWDHHRSRHVFVNSSLAINPPSFNVVTLDGLDQNGALHNSQAQRPMLADELVSHTIDMSTYTEGDNIYFSFFWQGAGNVEFPEKGDSLRLQFINSDSVWVSVWKVDGSEITSNQVFAQQIVRVNNAFLSDNFRFRFQSFGDLNGPFDAWHLDWVYLNQNRSATDLTYFDRAFSGTLSAPFAPFQAIPINQFRLNENQLTGTQDILLSNLDDNPHPVEIDYGLRDLVNSSLIDDYKALTNPLLQSLEIDTFVLPRVDFTTLESGDSIVIQTEVIWKTGDANLASTPVDLTVNDTIRSNFILHDYYAYDDGTAEFAAGTNIRNGQIAVKFWLEEPDTLTHIDINFPNIDPVSVGKGLRLNVFSELTDNELLRSQQILIFNNSTRDEFSRYELTRPIIVSDTFYIGYQQFVNDYIGIGFDRSNPDASSAIFENTTGNWEQNVRLVGSLMIRPVFKQGSHLVLNVPREELLILYPNPTDGVFAIGKPYDHIELIDLNGKVLWRATNSSQHSISNLKPGLYLLKIHRKGGNEIHKIIRK